MVTDVAIALGSNLGNSLAILEQALTRLSHHRQIEIMARSPWYRTKPIGPPQPDYINGCITCRVVNLTATNLLQILLATEQQFGRERRQRWGARTLDLDLILYGNHIIELPHLAVPHPRMQERAFVLVPLADIAADWLDPRSQQTIAQLKQQLEITGITAIAAPSVQPSVVANLV